MDVVQRNAPKEEEAGSTGKPSCRRLELIYESVEKLHGVCVQRCDGTPITIEEVVEHCSFAMYVLAATVARGVVKATDGREAKEAAAVWVGQEFTGALAKSMGLVCGGIVDDSGPANGPKSLILP